MQIFLVVGVTLFYFLMFFLMGISYMRALKKEKFSFSLTIIIGMFTYFLVFELIALPMKILGKPLHVLAYTWILILLFVGMASISWNYSYIKKSLKVWRKDKREERCFWILIAILVGIQLTLVLINTPIYMGVRDDSYYIADVSTSIYKDSIQQYNYITGTKLAQYNPSYFLPMYPMQSAVVCKLTGLHPIIENKWSSLLVMLIIANMVCYKMTKIIFRDGDKKKILLVMFFYLIIQYNLQSNGVTIGIFFFYRLSEGKGILSNILLPCLVYFFARIVRDDINKINWIMMLVLILSSFCIAMSAMFLIPVSLVGLFGAFLLMKRKWKYCLPVGICMVPCIGVLFIYLCIIKGYISLVIK